MRVRQTISVPDGSDIQAAILTMKPGDILSLATNGTYTFAGGVTGFSNLPAGFPKYPTTVRGNNATITGGSVSLQFSGKQYIHFENLNLIDAVDRCIMVTSSRYVTMTNLYADSNVGVALFDVFRFDQGCRNFTLRDCEAGPTTGWGEHDGFECTNQCGDFKFINCHAEGVIHGFETWSDGGALTWTNYRITIENCSAANCEVGYSAEGGPAGLSQIDIVVRNSTSTGMSEFDFQGIDGSTIYVDKFGGTWNGLVANLNLPYGGRYQPYLNKLSALDISFPTEAQMTKQNALVDSIASAFGGSLSKVKSLRIYAGSNPDASLVDVKRLTLMTTVNSPVYTEANGWQGDGATSYINTGFNAVTEYPTTTEQRNSGIIAAVNANSGNASTSNFRSFSGAPNLVVNQENGENQRRAGAFTTAFAVVVKTATYPDIVGGSRKDSINNENHRIGEPSTLSAGTSTPSTSHNAYDCARGGATPVYSSVPVAVGLFTEYFTESEFQTIATAIETYLS